MSIFNPAAGNEGAVGHNLLCDARCCTTAYASNSLLCNATHFSVPDPLDANKPKTFPSRRVDTLRTMARGALTLTGAHASRCNASHRMPLTPQELVSTAVCACRS